MRCAPRILSTASLTGIAEDEVDAYVSGQRVLLESHVRWAQNFAEKLTVIRPPREVCSGWRVGGTLQKECCRSSAACPELRIRLAPEWIILDRCESACMIHFHYSGTTTNTTIAIAIACVAALLFLLLLLLGTW